MDELVVRIARAVACITRLRLLGCLAGGGELAPTKLAQSLAVDPALVCAHLRRLSAAGLVQRRRSGRWRYCRAGSPYSKETLSGRVTQWLRDILRDPRRTARTCGVEHLRDLSAAEVADLVYDAVFEVATAFTSVRRLQILRRLSNSPDADVRTLSRELHMSRPAVYRHCAKLLRRGFVTRSRTARGLLTYRPAASFSTPLHARLFEIVRETWRGRAEAAGAPRSEGRTSA